MSPKEKSKFEEMAKTDKVRYDREMKNYVPPKGAKKGKKKKDPNAPKRPPYATCFVCLFICMLVSLPPVYSDLINTIVTALHV